jgi:single-strand DNA-binding protein
MPATPITVIGNLTDDPELRFTPAGVPVATFTVAVNERFRDGNGQWQDGATSFHRVNAWRNLAEHVAESLAKGARVMVAGTLRQRSYEAESRGQGDNGKRYVWEIHASDVGAALLYATAKISKAARSDAPMPEDPYATSAASSNGRPPASSNEANGYSDEPPF